MNSVIISDYGVMLAKTGERLVIRGPKPRLELIEGGPQLFLPLGINGKRPTLTVLHLKVPRRRHLRFGAPFARPTASNRPRSRRTRSNFRSSESAKS